MVNIDDDDEEGGDDDEKYQDDEKSIFLGSGPDRERSPVEWGDFPYVHPPVCPFPPLGQPAKPEAQPARPEAQKVPKKCLVWVFKVTCHHINHLKIKERKGVCLAVLGLW